MSMKRLFATLALSSCAGAALAQGSPVGTWKTIDDKTGQERSLVRIDEAGGVLAGRIVKRLDPGAVPNAVCDKCSDDRKGKPVDGLEIIRGVRRDGEVWAGGTILNPEEGRIYRLRLALLDGGRKLEVRGFFGPFYRNQQWIRVE